MRGVGVHRGIGHQVACARTSGGLRFGCAGPRTWAGTRASHACAWTAECILPWARGAEEGGEPRKGR
eukprot:6447642-Prymnesium_polylepis.1